MWLKLPGFCASGSRPRNGRRGSSRKACLRAWYPCRCRIGGRLATPNVNEHVRRLGGRPVKQPIVGLLLTIPPMFPTGIAPSSASQPGKSFGSSTVRRLEVWFLHLPPQPLAPRHQPRQHGPAIKRISPATLRSVLPLPRLIDTLLFLPTLLLAPPSGVKPRPRGLPANQPPQPRVVVPHPLPRRPLSLRDEAPLPLLQKRQDYPLDQGSNHTAPCRQPLVSELPSRCQSIH